MTTWTTRALSTEVLDNVRSVEVVTNGGEAVEI
jgi:hypothetical protein